MPRVSSQHSARLSRPGRESENFGNGDIDEYSDKQPDRATPESHAPSDSHVSISCVGRRWSLNTADGLTTWAAPPAVLGRVLLELFAAQPEDVLHWFHGTVWRMHAEEIQSQLLCKPDDLSGGTLLSSPVAGKPAQQHSWWPQPYGTASSMATASMPNYKSVCFARARSEEERAALELHFQLSDNHYNNVEPPSLRNQNKARAPRPSITGLAPSSLAPPPDYRSRPSLIPGAPQTMSRLSSSAGFSEIDDENHFRPTNALNFSPHNLAIGAGHIDPFRRGASAAEDSFLTGVHKTSSLRTDDSEANEVLNCSPLRASAYQMYHRRSDEILEDQPVHSSATGGRGSMMSGVGYDSMTSIGMKNRQSSIQRRSVVNGIKAITSLFSTPATQPVMSNRLSEGSVVSSYSYISFKQHFKSVRATSSGLMNVIMNPTRSELGHTIRGLSPSSLVYLFWNFLFSVFLVFEMWMVPFDLVFLQDCDRTQWLDFADVFLLSFFSVDVVMNFITGYVERGYIVRQKDLILWRYFGSLWFVIDVAATIPYAICMGIDVKAVRLIILLRLLRLHRVRDSARNLLRLLDVYMELWIHGHPLLVLLLIKLQVVLLLLVHFYAVLWAIVTPDGCEVAGISGAYERYYDCVWWATITLTCANSSAATTQGQRAVDMLAALTRLCLLLFVFTEAQTVMLGMQERVKSQLWRHEMLKYIRQRGASVELDIHLDNMLCNFEWVRNEQQHYERLNQQPMPEKVRAQLTEELWEQKLITMGLIYPLVVWEASFAAQLSEHVREDLLAPGITLFSTGELSHSAYLVLYGTFSAVDPVYDELPDYTRDMWVGEHALVNPELLRAETITCKDRAAIMSVVANDFRKLVARNGLAERFENMLQKTLWMGLCGRCGYLGDHFAKDCPLLQKRSWSRKLWRVVTLRAFRGGLLDPEDDVSPELLRFLEDHNLMRHKNAFVAKRIKTLTDLNSNRMTEMLDDPDVGFSGEEKKRLLKSVKRFRDKLVYDTSDVLLNSGSTDNHLMFISHYKVEAGTEAALMQKDLEKFIQETPGSPGHELESPVFVDTENLRDLNDLQDYVRRSHNLVLLLTPGVLTRPWVLVEIVTAVNGGVNIIPVEVQRPDMKFKYPGDEYYQRLRNGEELGASEMDLLVSEGIGLQDLEEALRQVFKRIATPFSPHKTAGIRDAELKEILKQCTLRDLRHGRSTVSNVKSAGGSTGVDRLSRSWTRERSLGKDAGAKASVRNMSYSSGDGVSNRKLRKSASRDLGKIRRLSTAALDAALDLENNEAPDFDLHEDYFVDLQPQQEQRTSKRSEGQPNNVQEQRSSKRSSACLESQDSTAIYAASGLPISVQSSSADVEGQVVGAAQPPHY